MKTKRAYFLTAALILPLLLLFVGCDSGNGMVNPDVPEALPGAFTINSSQVAMNPTTMEGTFEAFGAIDDNGASKEVLASAEPLYRLTSLSGRKTLEGKKGTIKIEFYVGLSPTNQNTISDIGGFQIVEGSGAYASLQGGGEIVVEVGRNAPPTALTQVLEGQAWFAQ